MILKDKNKTTIDLNKVACAWTGKGETYDNITLIFGGGSYNFPLQYFSVKDRDSDYAIIAEHINDVPLYTAEMARKTSFSVLRGREVVDNGG